MIQAKDLKLMRGNYVLVTFDETETGFGKDYIGKVDAIQRTKIMVEGDLHWHPIDKIKPVAISPDILLKCGFEMPSKILNLYNDWFIYDNGGIFYIQIEKQGASEYICERLKVECTYLHQLQNLYHSLTGSELNINF